MTTLLLWLDFETGGLIESGKPDPLVLEVGWSFTTPSLYPPGETRHRFVWDARYGPDPQDVWAQADPFAVEMHERSGLRAEWMAWADQRLACGRSNNLAEVDAAMTVDIESAKATYGAEKVMVAGSGVGPFDVPLLRHYFPATTRAVHYRPLDVSSVREMGKLVGLMSPYPDTERPHRAVGDVEWSIREARWWRDQMRALAPGKAAA